MMALRVPRSPQFVRPSASEGTPCLKKVLIIIARLNVGGPASHTIWLTDLLDSDRYQALLVSGQVGATEGDMGYMAAERGVIPLTLPELGREISWRDDARTLWKLMKIMRRERPDIIHTHTAKAGTLGRVAALAALPFRRKKLYHTFHGHVFHGYFSPRKTRAFIRIEQILGCFTHRLIAVSETTRRELTDYKIARPGKIVAIPLGLDLVPFLNCKQQRGALRAELGVTKEAALIGLVARLVPIKGVEFLLQAAKQICERHENVYFIIIGDGEMRQELEALAIALNLGDRARFLGFRQDLPALYADLDIVALSSLNEGLPVSLIEAMASGCVSVSTAVGGVPDLIEDGVTGFLCVPGDAPALTEAFDRALSRRGEWAEIGQKAQASTQERFHLDRMVADHEQLYAE